MKRVTVGVDPPYDVVVGRGALRELGTVLAGRRRVAIVSQAAVADHYGDDARVAAIEGTIPLGRMATPLEVGNVAVFLASDLASYVSGARVACDGGGEPPVFLHIT